MVPHARYPTIICTIDIPRCRNWGLDYFDWSSQLVFLTDWYQLFASVQCRGIICSMGYNDHYHLVLIWKSIQKVVLVSFVKNALAKYRLFLSDLISLNQYFQNTNMHFHDAGVRQWVQEHVPHQSWNFSFPGMISNSSSHPIFFRLSMR